MVLTRDAEGRWTLIDDHGVTTLARPPHMPLRSRWDAAVYLVRVAWNLLLRGHP